MSENPSVKLGGDERASTKPLFRPSTSRGWIVLVISFLLFAGGFVLRLTFDSPQSLVPLVFLAPIALITIRFGTGAGLAAIAFAVALLASWVVIRDVDIDSLGYLARIVGFSIVLLLGSYFYLGHEQAEGALHESDERYQRIVELANEGIWEIDADSRTTFINARMGEMLGYGPKEVIGKSMFEFMDDESRGRVEPDVGRGRRFDEQHEVRFRRKDAGDLWSLVSTTPVTDEDGRYVGAFAMVTDVTERVRGQKERDAIEAQLHQSQKLEAIGQLAGGVAHDFNNLLGVILSYSAFLSEELAESPLHEEVKEIRNAADAAAKLTQQLLVVGRREVTRPGVMDINSVVRDTQELLRRTIGDDIHFVSKLAPDLRSIKADRGQIEQVLINLVVNARDAMEGGGTLTIDTANTECGEDDAKLHEDAVPGRYVLLTVSDTGCGMDEEVASHIFEPFFSTKSKDKGSGLGLSTTYGIVKQAGGHIGVSSEPGQGTEMKIYLPATSVEAVESVEPNGSVDGDGVHGRGETVLVVEDEDAVRRGICRTLSSHGYSVVGAKDGDEALLGYQGREEHIDVLLTDVVMPGMSGKELARRLRELNPALGVLYVSGYTDDIVVRHGIREGSFVFLGKPFSPEMLLGKVREALDTCGEHPGEQASGQAGKGWRTA